MKPWMMGLVFGRRPQLVTVTFNESTTWPAPAGLSALASAAGKGAAGSPGSPGQQGWTAEYVTFLYRKDGGVDTTSSTGSGTGPVPGPSGCGPVQPINGSDIYTSRSDCAYYTSTTTGGSSPTTGASATGFGRTFPGGSGGPAQTTNFSNVPLNSSANPNHPNYPIVVPAGGSITISYYQ